MNALLTPFYIRRRVRWFNHQLELVVVDGVDAKRLNLFI